MFAPGNLRFLRFVYRPNNVTDGPGQSANFPNVRALAPIARALWLEESRGACG